VTTHYKSLSYTDQCSQSRSSLRCLVAASNSGRSSASGLTSMQARGHLAPTSYSGHAIALAVTLRLPRAAAWVRSQFRSCWICGGKRNTGGRFSRSTSVCPVTSHSIKCCILIYNPGLVQYAKQWPMCQVDLVSHFTPKKKKKLQLSWLPSQGCHIIRVRVTLRLAVYRRSVRLGAKSLEAQDQRSSCNWTLCIM
jgi:hypothetical protein